MLTAVARIATEDGREGAGYAADLLVPRWFDKDPSKSPRRNALDLIASARRAAAAMQAAPESATLFELWRGTYRSCVVGSDGSASSLPERSGNGLVDGFGVALLERATMDALLRASGQSFFAALSSDAFAFRPEAVDPALRGWTLQHSLPALPAASIEVRHTVGLLDPLRPADVDLSAHPDDGFPQSLEGYVRRCGLSLFKLKLSGDRARDAARLVAIARVLVECAPSYVRCTLDGNEQFTELGTLLRTLDDVRRDPDGSRLLNGLLYVEQPLARADTFDPRHKADLVALSRLAPAIIDEADDGPHAFHSALEAGYRGISAKNCKGVFRTLLHLGQAHRAGPDCFLAAEDLTNLPILPLHQDLATLAALGLPHAERNGHHYFRGLDHLPPLEREAALERHPDLYERRAGTVSLRIDKGRLSLTSLQCPGYGYAGPIDLASRHACET